MAEARRKARESSRREEMKTVYPKPTKRPMLNLSSEWGPGSEMYYESWKAVVPGEEEEVEDRGIEPEEGRKRRRRIIIDDENDSDWWEELVERAKTRSATAASSS